jgi:hypothetical protein
VTGLLLFSTCIVVFWKEGQAMRKRMRRRPEVEGLEAMTLLSGGMAAMAHQAVEVAAKKPVFPNPIHLVGTLNGTLTQSAKGNSIKVSGKITPVGKVSFTGPQPPTLLTGGVSNLVVPGKLGKVFVSLNLTPSGTSLSGTYTIVGGTKALAGETGSGNVTVALTSVGSPTHFSATFS